MANKTGKGYFEPGNNASPGRTSYADLIRKVGAETRTEGMTLSESIVRAAFNMALDPDCTHAMQAMKWIADRADGSIQQQIDLTTQGEKITGTLSESERLARLAELLDVARARRVGQADSEPSEPA